MDERLQSLVEQIAKLEHETEAEIRELAREVRRFHYWAEAVILHYESRLRALTKEPGEEPPAT